MPSAVILANYAAQVPYGLHLYGSAAMTHGWVPLLITLGWFVAGLWLLIRATAAGYWLTLSFLLADFGFYLYNLIGGWVHGYGLFFQAWQLRDPLLWAVFMIGYANFFAAGFLLVHLVRVRPGTTTSIAR
ncbi:MAG: hypothetical protein ACYDAL_03450 [Candidatus Dormibacteraceae bacterium]